MCALADDRLYCVLTFMRECVSSVSVSVSLSLSLSVCIQKRLGGWREGRRE